MSVPGTLPSNGRDSAHFSRLVRLRLSGDFQKVFADKNNFVGRLMVMWVGKPAPGAGVRLGVVASKRTFRRAVDRNRAKRLLREAFRLNRSGIAGDADLVIIARHRILKAKCADVEREFMWLIKKAGFGLSAHSEPETDCSDRRE